MPLATTQSLAPQVATICYVLGCDAYLPFLMLLFLTMSCPSARFRTAKNFDISTMHQGATPCKPDCVVLVFAPLSRGSCLVLRRLLFASTCVSAGCRRSYSGCFFRSSKALLCAGILIPLNHMPFAEVVRLPAALGSRGDQEPVLSLEHEKEPWPHDLKES